LDVIYVVDEEGKLLGSVSLHQLIRTCGDQKIEKIFDSNIQGACRADEPTAQVAQLMAEFDLQNLPVLDGLGRLVGMITHDDVIDILQESATKDIQILHGAGADENIHDPVSYSVAKRAPWLQFNLITAAMGALVVSVFQAQIEQLTLLAVFMTMITSLGGNAGGQTLAVAIRSLALGEWKSGDTPGIFLREMCKGLFNGSLTGLVAGSASALITRNISVGLTIFLAMTINMALCGISGALIPYILRKLRVDPAQSAYIFLTMVTDTVGMYIFLLLGCWLLL
jgi:magnesium transporter